MNNSRQQVKQTDTQKGNMRVSQAEMSVHSGPMPDPITLSQYNEIIPGAAERMLKMAELEQIHRHNIDVKLSASAVIMSYLGIFFAFLSVIVISSLVYYAISCGFSNTATYIGVGAIASVAGVFMFFKRAQSTRK